MTYVTPDDVAQREQMRDPWSEQGFVARARLARGTLDRGPLMPAAPVPPLATHRRNWVPVHMPGRFPTDPGYPDAPMNGLGEDSVATIMDDLAKEMKANAIKQAALNTGVSIALNFIPIVGWAASLVYSVFQAVSGASLQRQGQREMADLEAELTALGGAWQAKIDAAQAAAFNDEKAAGIALAISDTPLAGLGNWAEDIFDSQIFKELINPLRQIKQLTLAAPIKAVQVASSFMERIAPDNIKTLFVKVGGAADWVDNQTDRPVQAFDTAVDTASGMEGLNDTRAAIRRARAEATAEMNGQGALALNNIASPHFRENLRKQIALAIRNSVPFQTVLNGMKAKGMTAPQIVDAVSPPSTGLKAMPIIGAAGAAALILSMGT